MTYENNTYFERARSYEELLEVNKKFILGEIAETPYHLGPLEKDSLTLKDDLLALHDRGILTVNGQAGAAGTSYDEWCENVQLFVDTKQAPYLEFYMPKNTAAKTLINSLMNDRLIKYNIWDTRRGGTKILFASNTETFCVTYERAAPTITELRNTPWEEYTWINSHPPDEIGIPLIDDSDNYLAFTVFIPILGTEISLEQRLLKLF